MKKIKPEITSPYKLIYKLISAPRLVLNAQAVGTILQVMTKADTVTTILSKIVLV